jgi:serine phosphatase RsbU (regulator of sigma subunit)
MVTKNYNDTAEPKLTKVLREDFRHGDFKRTLRRDWNELKEFYIDQERTTRLQAMGKLKRFFVMGWWLLKSLFLKLTPVRRILVLISCWLILQSGTISYEGEHVQVNTDASKIGFVVLLFILMLELKDKLLAQSELAAGRSVQRALMPKQNPSVPGWEIWLLTRPANEVGGDLVDYLELGKNRFGVALADVAGKGLKAALLMVKLQATLRALAADFTSLAELGAKLNAILRRDGLPDSFASLVYLELQPASGTLRLLNAGHMPPLLLKGNVVEELSHGAAALGVLSEPAFVEQNVEMQNGDALLIYSDGLTEARNDAGVFFGEPRLFSFLPTLAGLAAHEVGARILADVESFVSEAKAHDDLSLIIMKRVA